MKTSKFILIVGLALVSLTQNQSWASPLLISSKEEKAFISLLSKAQDICPDLNCKSSSVQKKLITTSIWRKLSPEIRKQIQTTIKNHYSQIWPDTILEDDYVVKGQSRIDEVSFLIYSDEKKQISSTIVGYHVTFSVKAYDTSTCDYDPQTPSSLDSCTLGRIQESLFINNGFNIVVTNPYGLASFKEL